MCRQIAICAGFSRKKAIDILLEMEGCNKDGIGSVYVKDKQFIINKSLLSLECLLKSKHGNQFLNHLPHDGISIVHLRAASTGEVAMNNIHPFVVNDRAVVHNGIWTDHSISKLILAKIIKVKFSSETDSEVAANLLDLLGPETFAKEIEFAGVFLSLNRNGTLDAIKTSGDLVFFPLKHKRFLISSELDYNKYNVLKQRDALPGWYRFDRFGRYISHKETPTVMSNFDRCETVIK